MWLKRTLLVGSENVNIVYDLENCYKELEIKEVLDNILLPLDAAWCISSVRTDDKSGEIFLH